MNIEITLEELLNDGDWAQVFGDENWGNVSKDIESLDGTHCEIMYRTDVLDIIAAVNGENNCDKWVGVFLLKDGRYLAASGSCDYTGWDCQAGNCLTVASTLENVIAMGLTDYQRERLGCTISS